ncbi:CotH kinase family protein [uncultured Ruminococcus sp.]|uniref:CotH kinase family protein n=1 Tax=uncultured Ruminococcus sp. TaxID=165186 RepID=UPI0025D4B247|nr:CotH kinase family protein [uncultured Ruminococcus sp.]
MKFIKKITSFAAAFLMTASLNCGAPFAVAEQSAEGLCINEVCTQNKSSFKDSLGRASDWIELYNGSSADIDLYGFGLSDSAEDPMKYIFPSGTVIKKGGYLLIAANKDGNGMTELNTGFALSKSGETLMLSAPDGSVVQKLDIPALAEDETYGCSPDGSGSYSVMAATPASANLSAPAEPIFSLESGFYSVNDVTELELTSADTIYYTIDGSDPVTSETAKVYSGAVPMYDRSIDENIYSKYQHEDNSPYSITLKQRYDANPEKFDKATVVRAVSKSPDGIFSRVITKTYFIMSDEKLEYYSNIPVISLVTDPDNLFDKDKGIYVAGQQYLDWKNSPQYNSRKSEWDTDNVANFFSKGKEWEREADIAYFKDGALGFTQKMGIRIKGASTRNSQTKSFNIYARSEYGDSKLDYKLIDDNYSAIDGKTIKRYDSFSLRAVSWVDRMRERAVHSSLRDLPALATYDSDRCMLFIDGELWGMYEIMEKSSDYYIQTNYGIPSENVVMIKNGEAEEGTERDLDELEMLGEFCQEHIMSSPENYSYVASKIDIESLIDCYCAGLYLGTWDWPNYNYLMWRNSGEAIEGNPYSDGKWRCGSFDFDYSVGLTYQSFGGVEGYQYDSFRKMDSAKKDIPTSIFIGLLQNPDFKQQFADKFYSYAYSVFEPSKMIAELDDEENRYMSYMTMTAWRWNSGRPRSDYNSFMSEQERYYHSEMEKMRTFFSRRAEYAIEDMQNYLGISNNSATVTVTEQGRGTLVVDSIDTSFSGNVWTGSFDSGQKVTITAKPAEGYVFAGWSGAVSSDSAAITVTADKAVSLVCTFKKAEYEQGDMNMDGTVNVADLLLMSKYLRGSETISKMQFELADMNEDDSADIFDLVRLRKVLLK